MQSKNWIIGPLIALSFLAVTLIGIQLYLMLGSAPPSPTAPRFEDREPVDAEAPKVLALDEQTNIEIFENVRNSVVFITTSELQTDRYRRNVFEIPKGSGSGFVWDEEGHIVTNYHVVHGADRILITLDQETWEARPVGVAPDKDLVVLKIQAPTSALQPIALGTSHDLKVGQKVYAIGNPFGLDHTMTTGIVSALDREIQSITGTKIRDVIQTDAAINPGNSGGPLLDSAGLLIGVNTAIYSPSGVSAGIGFAVPVDTVRRVVPQLIRHGQEIRPRLGISTLDDATTRRLGIKGVLVVEVFEGSPAHKAGLQPTHRTRRGDLVFGDIVVGIDEQQIVTRGDLLDILDRLNLGDTIQLHLIRQNKGVTVPVQL